MVLAAKAVKDGEADAMLSAGNTGALLAAGFFIVGRIKIWNDLGLMSTLPTVDGKGFDMLDLRCQCRKYSPAPASICCSRFLLC